MTGSNGGELNNLEETQISFKRKPWPWVRCLPGTLFLFTPKLFSVISKNI